MPNFALLIKNFFLVTLIRLELCSEAAKQRFSEGIRDSKG